MKREAMGCRTGRGVATNAVSALSAGPAGPMPSLSLWMSSFSGFRKKYVVCAIVSPGRFFVYWGEPVPGGKGGDSQAEFVV